jgi:hypothetical protein
MQMSFRCSPPDGKVVPQMKFGNLTADSLVAGSARIWLCLCACGNKLEVWQTELLRGKKVSCGCLRSKNRIVQPLNDLRSRKDGKGQWQGRRIDLTGQKFNHLTAIKAAGYAESGNIVWEFLCDCGKRIVRLPRQVRRGDIKSCGCLKIQMIRERGTLPDNLHIKTASFKKHKQDAKKRELDSQLTYEQWLAIASQPCRYCGEFSIRKSKANPQGIKLNSVDRLNNEPYYTPENSVPACFEHQQMKMQRTEKEFLVSIAKVIAYQQGKLDDGVAY